MGIKNKKSSLPVFNMLGCVGWLEDIENNVIENEESACLLPELACRKTCGWTLCNTRCAIQHRGVRNCSAIKFSPEEALSRLHELNKPVGKAV